MSDSVRSMTGAGTFAVDSASGRIEAEARSVNHRFLKVSLRAQGPLPAAAALAEDILKKHLQRGHVSVHLRLRPAATDTTTARIDEAAFASAAARLQALASEHGLAPVSAQDVLRVPGVLGESRSDEDEAKLLADVRKTLEGVAQALQTSREREGALMAAEVADLLAQIARAGAALAARADELPTAYRDRLKKRLEDLLEGAGVEPDPAHLARECAVLAEKSDVREEIARIEAHVTHARELLAGGGAVGRRLDFLVQELHREANTVGSKANDLDLSRTVLDLRAAIERLREQVQNLE